MALIRYSIESDKVSEIPVKYSYLAQIADCRIISIVKKEVRIEMGFLVLSILYMQISKRKELLHQIEKLLITQEEYLFNNPHCDVVIQSRLCLLISTYYQMLFNKHSSNETESQNKNTELS